jgi:hypothetical protein
MINEQYFAVPEGNVIYACFDFEAKKPDRVGYICHKRLYTVAYQSSGTPYDWFIHYTSTKIDSHQKCKLVKDEYGRA